MKREEDINKRIREMQYKHSLRLRWNAFSQFKRFIDQHKKAKACLRAALEGLALKDRGIAFLNWKKALDADRELSKEGVYQKFDTQNRG